jgi:hypothetical protein
MNLDHIPIADHHAHPFLRPAAANDPARFRRWFTESTDPRVHEQYVTDTLVLRTAVRWLAELLGCDATLEAVVAARAVQPEEAWAARLFRDAKIDLLLCDYGYGGDDVYDHAAMQRLVPCRVEPILRLERLAEQLIVQSDSFSQTVDAYVAAAGRARADGYVALKSIIAYRSGLQIEAVFRDEAAADWEILKERARSAGRVRLDRKALCDYLVSLALAEADRQELPIQFHTGFGDADADLRVANPLHLRGVIERYPRLPLVLLHAGWPFYRELTHLAAIYPNVWLDLSLAIPFATTGIPAMLRDVLGMAPFSKVMFATDAFTMPEIYWIAAKWGRWGLGRVLDEFVADGFLLPAEAEEAAQAILHRNAQRLYLG